ncbi:lipoprotein [Neisseria arctica]|uniref:LPS-assembly lipoprotein LptE n=1 Tax=Neisseria arctica TaxID=1470200 RepID=A0A0J0YPP2_9NEIS|nr:LPS assembly lipoprotein LptE [Neisseria arctica]KLT72102.1 lipoprotein [Neisseria arctica]UOO85919.1 LPS assembly lipoprotein LptE [Neisseria arctica]
MNKILMLAVAFMLSACGFHLKGHIGMPSTLPYQTWYVDGGALQQVLETALHRADGKPVAAPDAQAEIRIVNVDMRKDIYTITQAAAINEYLLALRVVAEVSRNGEKLGEPIEVVIQRPMEYADSEVLGKQEEEATIWAEMRTDAAEQIIRRLTFLKAD